MKIANIPVVKHTVLEYPDHITHVFKFNEAVEETDVISHPAVAALISRKAQSNYMICSSNCPKTFSLKILQ